MSASYATVINFKGSEEQNTEIPCDEPPSDSIFVPIQSDYFYACSGLTQNSFNGAEVLISATRNKLADEVTFYPSDALNGYIFGAGYRYVRVSYAADEFATQAEPVVINQ